MTFPSMVTLTIVLSILFVAAPIPSFAQSVTSFFLPALHAQPYSGSIIHQERDGLILAVSCDSSALHGEECALQAPATITASGSTSGHLDMSVTSYGSLHMDCTANDMGATSSISAVCHETWTADKDAATTIEIFSKYGTCTTITTSIAPTGLAPRTVIISPAAAATATATATDDCECDDAHHGTTATLANPAYTYTTMPSPVTPFETSSEASMTMSTSASPSSLPSSSSSSSSASSSPSSTDYGSNTSGAGKATNHEMGYQLAISLAAVVLVAIAL